MRYISPTLIVLCTATLLSAGCTTVSQPEQVPGAHSNQEIIQTSAVDSSYPGLKRIIASQYLVGYISVVNPKLGSQGSFSKAQVTVQNLTQNRYELEYQYQWEDNAGFAVASPRPWKRFVLGPKEAKVFSEMALRQDASQTMFTVRLVDDAFIELNKQRNKK
ncbi:DUF1425 domain-containing protein [Desulfogranum mediterraneum]|uniref:DUF1425 domain-containing protein n=1 Tax=Desulfogranum mediterraneum TaxID=160661 RepID=UPI0004290C4A|nr:DUF1425 domain-containing protein [Desulfogranum mediterraneum]